MSVKRAISSMDATAAGPRTGSWQAWAVAVRPRTLPAAISPVVVGASLGWMRSGALDWVALALVFAAAMLMQVITNMQNDVGYTVRGGESTGTRTGLPRATARGWLSVRHVRTGIVVTAVAAAALGVALVAWGGWPVLAIGVASLLAALAYMGGPRPIAYSPYGELTVFIFFGMVAVMGTDWVLTGSVGATTMLASIALGGLAAAALAVNNHRDLAHDRLVGRRTFAVTVGETGSRALYATLLISPFAVLPLLALAATSWWLLLPLLLLPAALQLRRDFDACPRGVAFNQILFRTFRMELWFSAALGAGAVLQRLFS